MARGGMLGTPILLRKDTYADTFNFFFLTPTPALPAESRKQHLRVAKQRAS